MKIADIEKLILEWNFLSRKPRIEVLYFSRKLFLIKDNFTSRFGVKII